MNTYSYSKDEENYFGDFPSVEEACKEAAAERGVGAHFWVGENVPPTPPEDLFDASDWLECVSVQDDYDHEHGVDWDRSTKEQRAELELEVRKLMAAWLDRHDLRPTFFTIAEPREFYVAGKVGDVFEVEAV